MAIKWSARGTGPLEAKIPSPGFRFTALAVVICIQVAALIFEGPTKPVLIGLVFSTPVFALIAPEIVEFWSWFAGKAEEHAVNREERIYRFGYTDVRMLMDEGNRPRFAADDICSALGLSDVKHEIKRFDKAKCTALGGGAEPYLSEVAVMRLIERSRRADARSFRLWFTREVMFPFNRAREKAQEPKPGESTPRKSA